MNQPAAPAIDFAARHIGPRPEVQAQMLSAVSATEIEELMREVVPASIRLHRPLDLPAALSERAMLDELAHLAELNHPCRALIGAGYYGTQTPPLILRNILENPGWYTQYTPYQAEIAQGRLEALINFQTMVADLTGLPLANASLLDEATAAAEAMAMCLAMKRGRGRRFIVDSACHPQTLAVLETRADALEIELVVSERSAFDFTLEETFGVLFQYPDSDGIAAPIGEQVEAAKAAGLTAVVATDLLALTLLTPPGELGAEIAVGSTQRFGVPLGGGGPHAAFISTHEKHKRLLPGRIVGVSVDRDGRPAYRLALQTREQHIRRDKATSNICTAQVLLAVIAGMYAVYHGPEGLRAIGARVKRLTDALAVGLRGLGFTLQEGQRFDTLLLKLESPAAAQALIVAAENAGYLFRDFGDERVALSLDERSDETELGALLSIFAATRGAEAPTTGSLLESARGEFEGGLARSSDYLTHPVFHMYRSEHEMLRYIHRLQARDLSLIHSMIPLGSCTMKLNASAEMIPISYPGFADLHPFAPAHCRRGTIELAERLERWLAEITGFTAVSLQPNAGSQGEYAGLLVIRAYHKARGDHTRKICLIPTSAHGTNPASAVMAGFKVVPVRCDERGDIDLDDLEARLAKHRGEIGAMMITYPSTHGVFEEGVVRACALVHSAGGQVYMDGANMNAQVGLCRPGDIGADVCHLNLHKTFCIPHGGGGPGVGPIGVAAHLAPYLPGHPLERVGGENAIGPVSAAPHGSAGILPISYAYIAMMGPDGLRRATEVAILNANYMATRLADHYPILYTGDQGRVAHEFILDCRPFKVSAGIGVDDIAKRLMDYGFHAPTMSWPVAGTLMVEPTESESLAELDRFCDAMIAIREEIRAIEEGESDREDNPLKGAPHPVERLCATPWPHGYDRERAVYPLPWVRAQKFWPSVGRVDNSYGDRNLVCSCPPMESYAE